MIKCIIGFLRTQKIEFHFISWPKKDTYRGESRDCEKVVVGGRGGALYVSHHGCPTKKTLVLRWSNIVRSYKFKG